MNLIILKNEKILVQSVDQGEDGEYKLLAVPNSEMPIMPAPQRGKYFVLEYIDDELVYVAHDRELTPTERMEEMQEELDRMHSAWKVGEKVEVNDQRTYNNIWYTCLQGHVTQADWTPDLTPALWRPTNQPEITPEQPLEASDAEAEVTEDVVIPYNNAMALVNGSYYSQDGVTYLCTRDTEVPVYNNLIDLVGIYVELVE